MIPKNVKPGAVATGLTGETAKFTIAANGKAFRTLIDGLYSNKVQAVIRELCSNAYDSQVAAGNADKPFDVTVPTQLHPVFRVRDYGTGLSHDDVLHLYTTIFQSTKENTNEQTGQLGLGSKSPFAYTDSFQVTVWDGTTQRAYIAFLETDGVPSITHVGDSPSTEPRGLEVSFAADRQDISRFQREMQFVSIGYDVKPNVEGMTLSVPTPRISGKGWAIYPTGAFGDEHGARNYIRQGSAVYPNNQYPFPGLGYGWISVIDIPIGTAEVTASREALSYDRETIDAVNAVLREASTELKTQIEDEIDAAETRIQKARVHAKYNGIFPNIKGSVMVSLLPDNWKIGDDKPAGAVLEKAEYFGKAWPQRGHHRDRIVNGFEVQNLDKVTIVVNDAENKVVRRQRRIHEFAADQGYFTYVLDVSPEEARAAIAWIKKCFEFNDDRFVVASTLPDIPPAKIKRAPSVRRALKPGQYWILRTESRVRSIWGDSDRGIYEWPIRLRENAKAVGFNLSWDDTFFVNQVQYDAMKKRGELPENKRLDLVIKKEMEKALKRHDLESAVAAVTLDGLFDSYNTAHDVLKERFFAYVKMDKHQARQICELASTLGVDLRNLPAADKIRNEVRELQQKFPLCFRNTTRSHFEGYIDAIQANA